MQFKDVRIAIYAFITLSFALGACQSETLINPISDTIELSAEIQPIATTRLNIHDDGKGSFDEGDHIQLQVAPTSDDSHIYELTYRNGLWTPSLSWADINADKVSFFATYPTLQSNDAGEWIHKVSVDQRHGVDYQNSDLLCAYTYVQRKAPVQLSFAHAMSRVSVTLKSGNHFTEQQLASAVVSIRAFDQISVQPGNGALGAISGAEQKIIFHHNQGTATFNAIVCPQKILSEWKEDWWIEIKIGEQLMKYKAPLKLKDGTPMLSLQSGKELSLTISLNDKEYVEEDWSNQTVWVYGVRNPKLDEWGYAFPNTKVLGLTWKAEYGWYDCNKKYSSRNEGGKESDSEMCWAAANSNSIHWWLEQNKDYIKRYGTYTGPSHYSLSDSEVFSFFKKHFENTGNDLGATLSWFFTGRYGLETKDGAAFFEDVLGKDEIVARIVSVYADNMTQEIKKALQSKEAITCGIKLPRLNHAISIWGADFDSDGNVSAIYIADSNDRDISEQEKVCSYYWDRCRVPAGLIRKPIKIRDGNVYMESSSPGYFTIQIYELNFLSLKTKEWEDYFRRHPKL